MHEAPDRVIHDLVCLSGRPELVRFLTSPPHPGAAEPTLPQRVRNAAEARLVLLHCWEAHQGSPTAAVLHPLDLPPGLEHLARTRAGVPMAAVDDNVLGLVRLLCEDLASGMARVLVDGRTPSRPEQRWIRLAGSLHRRLDTSTVADHAGIVRLARALAASRGGTRVTRAILKEAVAAALTDEGVKAGASSAVALPPGALELPPELRDSSMGAAVRAGVQAVLFFPEALLPWPGSNSWADLRAGSRLLPPLAPSGRLRGLTLVDLVGLFVSWVNQAGQTALIRKLPLPVATYAGIQTALKGATSWPAVMEAALRGVGWWEPLAARTDNLPATLAALFKEPTATGVPGGAAPTAPSVHPFSQQLSLFEASRDASAVADGTRLRRQFQSLITEMHRHVTGHHEAVEDLAFAALLHRAGALHARPVLVGEAGVGKTSLLLALVAGLRSLEGDEDLSSLELITLSAQALVQTGWKGQDLGETLGPYVQRHGRAAPERVVILVDEADKVCIRKPIGPHLGPATRTVELSDTALQAAIAQQAELASLIGRGFPIQTAHGPFLPDRSVVVMAGVFPLLSEKPTVSELIRAGFGVELASRVTQILRLRRLEPAEFAALARRHIGTLVQAADRLAIRLVVEESALRFLAQQQAALGVGGTRAALGLLATVGQSRLRAALASGEPDTEVPMTIVITPDDLAIARPIEPNGIVPERGDS